MNAMSQLLSDVSAFNSTYSKLMTNYRTHAAIVQVLGELGIVKDLLQDTFRKLKLNGKVRFSVILDYTACYVPDSIEEHRMH